MNAILIDSTEAPALITGTPELDLIGAMIGRAVADAALPVRLTHNNPRLPSVKEKNSALWFLRRGMRGLCAMTGVSQGYILRMAKLEEMTK